MSLKYEPSSEPLESNKEEEQGLAAAALTTSG